MAKKKKNIKRRKRTLKKKFNKRGGNPQANLKKKTNKIIKDEFSQSFVIAGDVGYSPRAPELQAQRTLYLRESQKGQNRKERKSKVTGFEKAQKSDSGLMSAIKQGYASGLTGAAALRSRGQSALQTLGGITGALGGPSRIPTSMGEIGKLTSQLLPPGKQVKGRTGFRGRRSNFSRTSNRQFFEGQDGRMMGSNGPLPPPEENGLLRGSNDMPPPPPSDSDEVRKTGDDVPPPPPDEDEQEYCPICGNKISKEIKMNEITDKLTLMAKNRLETFENIESVENYGKKTFMPEIEKLKTEIEGKMKEKTKQIKEQEERDAGERNKKKKEKAKKRKNKKTDIKKKCQSVIELKNNQNTDGKAFNELLEELEKALQN